MFSTTLRVIKFSWKNIWRNFWLSIITMSTIIITLFSISLVLALGVGLKQIIKAAEEHIDMSVYFYPSVTDTQANSVITVIEAMPGIQEVVYITKEQSLASYEKRAQDSPELLAPLKVIGQNPFGATVTIRANEPTAYQRVIDELNKPQYKDLIEGQKKEFEENRKFIDSFTAFTDKIKISGLIISVFFAIIAALLIFNAIRVAIYTHREEIAIMKLVGATNWFVRAPFIMETIIYSAVAVLISGGLFFILMYFLQPYLDGYFGGDVAIYSYFSHNALVIFGVELLATIFLNIITGSLALRRYLRV